MRQIRFLGICALIFALCLSLCSCDAIRTLISEASARRVPPSEQPCDHIESDWITVTDATCTEKGTRRTECTVCGATLRTEVGFSEHKYEFGTYGKCINCADERYTEGLEYSFDELGGFYIVYGKGDCTDTDIVIPPTFEGYPVLGVFTNAFSGDETITSLTVTRAGVYIDPFSFQGCSSLRSVNLSASVTVGAYCFDGCTSLNDINIPKDTKIGGGAFRGCSPNLKARFEVSDNWLSGPIGYMGGSQLSQSLLSDPEKAGKYLLSTSNFVWRKS